VRDQSHLEEMRQAIRGDRERAAARRRESCQPRESPREGVAEESVPTPEPVDPEPPSVEPETGGARWARLFRR
jgi:hypothetical protein